jgi:hypothetical protein
MRALVLAGHLLKQKIASLKEKPEHGKWPQPPLGKENRIGRFPKESRPKG